MNARRGRGEMGPPMTWSRACRIWAALAAVAVGTQVAALCLGSVYAPPSAWLGALFGAGADSPAARIVLSLRLPRVAAGFATGALLSVAGALLQVLLRNPLADPYMLGVSGGAAVFALAALALAMPPALVSLGAFAGALVSIVLLVAVSRRALTADGTGLLLTGVVLATGWGALLTLLLSLADALRLRSMLFWLAGDLGGQAMPTFALLALPLVLVAILPSAGALNVLTAGDDQARALGVPVRRLRLRVFLVASLATAVAVTTAGTIGFVGLVVPHLLRHAFGNDQRMLLPAAALGGGALVVAADLLARTAVAPLQLPLGAVTAVLGVPMFLWLLQRAPR
ncbi:FecCD family ABC transporter permease [Chitinasiproducens palmae]|uniref:Iron complex transport system permease protein n=1 Tax=Chitinasiproducens palmae TaxID=1770053 RepID=A0A1H2PMV7_9BURK|nr:iron ABC transporter permease [Chitinasiproducens palmae]SDV48006.1 iron complex transport system permease protein [Chitinasiproducens palmae]